MQLSNNLTELKAQIKDLQQQIYLAVSPILNEIEAPAVVNLSGVYLRFTPCQEIGSPGIKYILELPKIDITLHLNEFDE